MNVYQSSLLLTKTFIIVTLIIVVTYQKEIFFINLYGLNYTFSNKCFYFWPHNECFSALTEVTRNCKLRASCMKEIFRPKFQKSYCRNILRLNIHKKIVIDNNFAKQVYFANENQGEIKFAHIKILESQHKKVRSVSV